MVTKEDIIKIARKEKLPLGTVEKDFVLTYILRRIYDSELKDKLVFKGGTALHKIYLHKRLSIDLDFSELKSIKIGDIKNIIEDKEINSKIEDLNENRDSINIILNYTSVLNYKNNFKIQISKREKPILKIAKSEKSSFHGLGREDIDARCLDYRPFVIEIEKPIKRKIN